MPRNRASAKKAGTTFEQNVCDYLRCVLGDDRIERRAKRGTRDAGDVAGLRIPEGAVVMECKDERNPRPWGYLVEAERERANARAALGVVCMHVQGYGRRDMGRQLVAMERAAFNVFFETDMKRPVAKGLFRADKMREWASGPHQFIQLQHRTDGRLMVLMTLQSFAAELAGGAVLLETERWVAEWKRRPQRKEL